MGQRHFELLYFQGSSSVWAIKFPLTSRELSGSIFWTFCIFFWVTVSNKINFNFLWSPSPVKLFYSNSFFDWLVNGSVNFFELAEILFHSQTHITFSPSHQTNTSFQKAPSFICLNFPELLSFLAKYNPLRWQIWLFENQAHFLSPVIFLHIQQKF